MKYLGKIDEGKDVVTKKYLEENAQGGDVEAFIPLSRDFNDDFNDDYAR